MDKGSQHKTRHSESDGGKMEINLNSMAQERTFLTVAQVLRPKINTQELIKLKKTSIWKRTPSFRQSLKDNKDLYQLYI